MRDFNKISEDLFNKIRGRFPNVTIGDEEGNVTNEPTSARYFDFEYTEGERPLGKVSVSITEDDGLTVIFSNDFIQNEEESVQKNWYNFLKELRIFSKKRLLNFDVRNINKTNLTKRDYKFLANNRTGDDNMNESKLYGTNKISYQNVDAARIVIKHTESIDAEIPAARTRNVRAIYIENNDGERFKYPYRHLSGARAMARHVAEGGKPYDEFGEHILGLSEELAKLRKFKNYVGRSSVMAEGLSDYMGIVSERISTVKKTIDHLQRKSFYQESFSTFVKPVMEEVPDDIKENWIDQLTIRQFNEELKDVFPYIYKLVSEKTQVKDLSLEDIVDEAHGNSKIYDKCWDGYKKVSGKTRGEPGSCKKIKEENDIEEHFDNIMGQFNEDTTEANTLYVKFRGKNSKERDKKGNPKPYLVAFASFVHDPKDVKFNNSLRQYTVLRTKDEIANAVKDMMTDKVFVAAKEIVLLKRNSVVNRFSQLNKFFNWLEGSYTGNKLVIQDENNEDDEEESLIDSDINTVSVRVAGYNNDVVIGPGSLRILDNKPLDVKSQVEITNGEYSGHKGIVTDVQYKKKKDKEYHYTNIDTKTDKVAPEKKMTRYFKIDNGKLFNFMRREMPDFMQKYFKSTFGGFMMNDKAFTQFQKFVDSPKTIEKFGVTTIDIDDEKSFAEDEITTAEQKTPLSEFILSYYDRDSGSFPKGETAVLTMVEKDYGEEFIEPAKGFIENVNRLFKEHQLEQASMSYNNHQIVDSEQSDIMRLAGL